MNKYSSKVYKYLTLIPKGMVSTYGDIALFLGNKNLSRVVGNILHHNPDPIKYSCYKIVDNQGKLSSSFSDGGIEVQKSRLEKDGIEVNNYQVDLKKYRFILK